ncbi:hypothetical protein [Streptomyces bullii]|uniref:Uncharacterized protein n=1 Tax=Streptomyces bullii TaxID=349910 RepID=A0ABW0V513_9ACTN
MLGGSLEHRLGEITAEVTQVRQHDDQVACHPQSTSPDHPLNITVTSDVGHSVDSPPFEGIDHLRELGSASALPSPDKQNMSLTVHVFTA